MITPDQTATAQQQPEYRFAEHGASRRLPWWLGYQFSGASQGTTEKRQRDRSGKKAPYTVSDPIRFNLAQFAEPEQLHTVYRILESEGGSAPGIDGLTYSDLSPNEVYGELRRISTELMDQSYCPQPTRLVRIPKRDGRFRELQLPTIIDRTVAKALQVALDGFWRQRLPRLGKDVWWVFAKLQQAIRQHRAFVLAVDDIRDCFPSTPIAPVLECHQEHISQPDLGWLIETVIRGHEGPNHQTGLYQGSPYSPVASELLLHTCLDTGLEGQWRGFPLLLRYADNLNIVVSNEREGYQALQRCSEILAENHFELKGDGFTKDLRDESFGESVLGMIPGWKNGQLTLSVPESSFAELQEALAEATIDSRPLERVKGIVVGWLNAFGPTLTNAVRSGTVERVVEIARECGFYELQTGELREIGRKARNRWLELSGGKEFSTNG